MLYIKEIFMNNESVSEKSKEKKIYPISRWYIIFSIIIAFLTVGGIAYLVYLGNEHGQLSQLWGKGVSPDDLPYVIGGEVILLVIALLLIIQPFLLNKNLLEVSVQEIAVSNWFGRKSISAENFASGRMMLPGGWPAIILYDRSGKPSVLVIGAFQLRGKKDVISWMKENTKI